MSDRQSDGNSSSAESDDSRRDPFDEPTEDINYVDGSPRSADEIDPSPSQYRAEKLRRDAAHEFEEEQPPDLTSDSDDDEEPLPVQHSKYSAPKNQRSATSEAVYSKFLRLGRQFVAELEDARKEQLIQRKSAKQSLDFEDEMPPPRSKSRLAFTPPRKSRELIPASQEFSDCERDSLASQSSSRKRLQEKFRVVGTKSTSDCTPQQINEWLHATARADMNKAGNYEDLNTRRETIGGFVRTNVSFPFLCKYVSIM